MQKPWGRRQLGHSEGERKVCSKDGKKLVWLQRSEQEDQKEMELEKWASLTVLDERTSI